MGRIRRDPGGNAQAVYSTESGRIARAVPVAPTAGAGGPDGIVRVSRTRAGRRGKTVTLITGIPASEVADMARDLKRLCGSGGSVKDGVVEVQGDHRDQVAAHLRDRYRVVLAGG